MALQNSLLNLGLNAMAEDILEVSLHEDDPGSSGDNELEDGDYERQSVEFDGASGGSIQMLEPLTFEVPGGSTVAWIGLWGDGGVWHGGVELATSEEFSGDGQYTLNTLIINAS